MATLPTLLSKDQIAGQIIDGFLSRVSSINDLNKGSIITQFIEAIAQSNFKAAAAVISMIDALSIDRATGEALQRLANDKNVPIFSALPSSGLVDITDLSFTKVETTVYAGQPAPVAGTLDIYVADASNFSTTGRLYIGRGTSNVEGPLTYTSAPVPLSNGSYWRITLDGTSPTTKFHNIGETVLLGQGNNRTINSNTVVQTKQANSVTPVTFSTVSPAVILDGDVTVTNISVVCQSAGPSGNVPRGAIQEAVGLAFAASVFNNQPFSNGVDADTDDTIRERIKLYEQTKAKGTELAIQSAALNVVAADELKRVTSSNVVTNADNSAVLVIDDGTGYEYNYAGVGIEQIVDSAVGGEINLQLRQRPIAPTRVATSLPSPYNVIDQSELSVTIAGNTTVHTFVNADFLVPGSASALEVATSINGDPLMNCLAATADNGTKVTLYSRDLSYNDIMVDHLASNDANDVLGFSLSKEYTARLYKNNLALYQDGLEAAVSTNAQSSWISSINTGVTLEYSVDNTPTITTTFNTANFQAISPTATVNYLTDITIWAAVMNAIMPGITASVQGNTILLTSNKGASDSAKVEITGGTLKDLIFPAGTAVMATGRASDYTLNRQTGQIGLVVPLVAGDQVTAGSTFTRAKVLTTDMPTGTSVNGRVWFIADGLPQIIPNSLLVTTNVTFTKTAGTAPLTIVGTAAGSGNPEGFDLVEVGDWVLLWANPTEATLVPLQGWWRVETVDAINSTIVVNGQVDPSGISSTVTMSPDRLVVARSPAPIQKLEFPASQALGAFITSAQSQLSGIKVELIGSAVQFSTRSAVDGDITVLAVDSGGETLGLPVGTVIEDIPSHSAFNVTTNGDLSIPSFTHNSLTSVTSDTTVKDALFAKIGGQTGDFIEILNQYSSSLLTTIPDSDKSRHALVTNFNGTDTLTLLTPTFMKTGVSGISGFTTDAPMLQPSDRYYIRSPYQFDSSDNAVVIIDNQPTTQSYSVPVARRLAVSGYNTTASFSATDAESSFALSDTASFGAFDFTKFKVWRQSHAELTDSTAAVYELKLKSADFGPSGNKLRIGLVYPDDITITSLSHHMSVSDVIDIDLILPFTNVPTGLDGTTSFTTAVTNSGGSDTVTYTYRIGTAPSFTGIVSPGQVAIISSSSDFLTGNKGFTSRITGVTPTTFTIVQPKGSASSDALSFSDIVNTAGLTTVTTATAHSITTGDRVGFYNTGATTGVTKPFDTTYYATDTSTGGGYTFTVPTPAGVPGGTVVSGTWQNNVATINCLNAHNLQVGNIVNISGMTPSGNRTVTAIPTANQFKAMAAGSGASFGAGGRFDFQSFGPTATNYTIATISRAATGLVTVTTTAGFPVTGAVVQISSVVINAWSAASAYIIGDVVSEGGFNWKCKLGVGPTITTPTLDSTHWDTTTLDLTGNFYVYAGGANPFTYYYNDQTGSTAGTGGIVTVWSAQGALARSVGASGSLLSFGTAETTAQGVVDYVSNNMADLLSASELIDPAAVIAKSTADENMGTSYLSGNITSITATKSSRIVQITVNTVVGTILAGSTIHITTSSAPTYSGTYVVQSISGSIITAQSPVLAILTGAVATSSGTFYGSTPYIMAVDGENFVESQNLSGNPMLTMKWAWALAPDVSDEIRLLAYTSDQITRFWNNSVVSGLSNVASVENNQYGSQVQITSNTSGSSGSVQISGGYANSGYAALVGSATETDRVGYCYVPYDLRKGMNARHWIKIQQTVQQNKDMALGDTSSVFVHYDGLELNYYTFTVTSATAAVDDVYTNNNQTFRVLSAISPGTTLLCACTGAPATSGTLKKASGSGDSTITFGSAAYTGTGSFQTKRATTADYTTKLRMEQHGNFLAFIHISGTNPSFYKIEEGDWVRIQNVLPRAYNLGVDYIIGNKVTSSAKTYFALAANGPTAGMNAPTGSATSNTWWQYYTTYSTLIDYSPSDPDKKYALADGRLWYAKAANGPSSTVVDPGTDLSVWTPCEFAAAHNGIYPVVRVFPNASAGGTFWIELPDTIEDMTQLLDPNDMSFYTYDSVMPGDTLVISGDAISPYNIGSYTILDDDSAGASFFPTANRIYTDQLPYLPYSPANGDWSPTTIYTTSQVVRDPYDQGIYELTGTPTLGLPPHEDTLEWTFQSTLFSTVQSLGSGKYLYINVNEVEPIALWKRIVTVGPATGNQAAIVVDSPNQMNSISSSSGAYITMQGKLGYDTAIHYGLDGYKYFQGLIAEVNKVIYGDPTNSVTYPGVRAAGTDIDIAAAILKRIYVSLSIRMQTGIPFTEIREQVKASVAGYVNTLGVGEQVSISEIIAAANAVNGVISVAVISPTYNTTNDLIVIGANEKAIVLQPTSDVQVSVV